jgi:hypothetical protein
LSLHAGGDGGTGSIPDMNGANIILLQILVKPEIFAEERKRVGFHFIKRISLVL